MVIGVIVQVTHNDYLRVSVGTIDRVADVHTEHSGCVTSRTGRELASVTARPVVRDHMDLLGFTVTDEITGNEQLKTRLDLTTVGIVCFEFITCYMRRLEERRVIQEAHIHTTAIGTLQENRFEPTTIGLIGLPTEVIETTNILHLGYTDTSGTTRIIIQAQSSNGLRHLLDFVLVLVRVPFHTAVGQVLIVVFALIVNRVKEVLQVVKSNTTDILTLTQLISLFVFCAQRSAAC